MVTAGGLHRAACRTTENVASSIGTSFIRGIQCATFGTKPLVCTDGSAVFDRAVRIAVGTHPSFAFHAERLCFRTINAKATAAPGFMRRAYFVRTVRLVAARTFPAVYARGSRIINAFAACFTAPTVMLRTCFVLQMPDFAPGIIFVDVTVPGMRAGCFFRRIIRFPTVVFFAVPVTLRARFVKSMLSVARFAVPAVFAVRIGFGRMMRRIVRAPPVMRTTVRIAQNLFAIFVVAIQISSGAGFVQSM